ISRTRRLVDAVKREANSFRVHERGTSRSDFELQSFSIIDNHDQQTAITSIPSICSDRWFSFREQKELLCDSLQIASSNLKCSIASYPFKSNPVAPSRKLNNSDEQFNRTRCINIQQVREFQEAI